MKSAPERRPARPVAAPQRSGDDRRSYEAPRITFHEALEGVASVCSPDDGGKGTFPCVIASS